MMDADKFMHDAGRMCGANENCTTCNSIDCCSPTSWRDARQRTRFIENVRQWTELNPETTMLWDFLEKYPKAMLDERGLPSFVCPHYFGYDSEPYCATGHSDCVKCWNRPLED